MMTKKSNKVRNARPWGAKDQGAFEHVRTSEIGQFRTERNVLSVINLRRAQLHYTARNKVVIRSVRYFCIVAYLRTYKLLARVSTHAKRYGEMFSRQARKHRPVSSTSYLLRVVQQEHNGWSPQLLERARGASSVPFCVRVRRHAFWIRRENTSTHLEDSFGAYNTIALI